MEKKEQRPARPEPVQGEINFQKASWICKDNLKLTQKQEKAVRLLQSGKFSAADISAKLFCSSGRDVVRNLRDKGVPVLDEWAEANNIRFKRYWIESQPKKLSQILDLPQFSHLFNRNQNERV